MPFSLKVKQFAFKCLLIVNHPKASEHGLLGIEENEHARFVMKYLEAHPMPTRWITKQPALYDGPCWMDTVSDV